MHYLTSNRLTASIISIAKCENLAYCRGVMNNHSTLETPVKPLTCPWGRIEHHKQVAAGITIVSTASHGGVILSEELQAVMVDAFPDFTPWATTPGEGRFTYWEEDADAIIPLVFFGIEPLAKHRYGITGNPYYSQTIRDWAANPNRC